MKHLLYLFSVPATLFAFISCSEAVEDPKELHKQVLADIHLTLYLLENLPHVKNKKFRNARFGLDQALKKFERTLKSDQVIHNFCGDTDKIQGENPGQRMLRIYKRDTRNPFAERVTKSRMIKPKEAPLPAGISVEYLDQWTDLMDRDLIHFSTPKYEELKELEEVVASEAIDKVKTMVNEKFVEQGGSLVDGKVDFSRYNVESRANIYRIDQMSYKNVFVNLDQIKFTKK